MKPKLVVGGAVAVALLLDFKDDGGRANVHCANVGDARAVLCRAQVGVRLSRDFKPFDDDECPRILGPGRRRFSSYVVRHRRYDRIQSLGGFVSLRDGGRVCDDLALTRALGDLHLALCVGEDVGAVVNLCAHVGEQKSAQQQHDRPPALYGHCRLTGLVSR